MRADASSWFKVRHWLGLVAMLVSSSSPAPAEAQARLAPMPGSPFFAGISGLQALATSPDGSHLYAVSFSVGSIAAYQLGPSGDPMLAAFHPSLPPAAFPGGLAFSPGGDQLYVGGLQQIGHHQVFGEGQLSSLATHPAVVPWSNPLNGLAYLARPGGDFLFVNDNAVPSSVSAWRVGVDGALVHVASFPSGGNGSGESAASLIAAPRLAAAGDRLFTLDAPGRNSVANSTVTVFDVAPDGTLTPAPGSPWDMGSRAGAIVADPTGGRLYVGGGGTSASVMKFEVTPEGALVLLATGSAEGMVGKPNGLALDPSGRFVAFTATLGGGLTVLDAATLAPIEGGRVAGANLMGLTFDRAGRLYVADAPGSIHAFEILSPRPPLVSCMGTPDQPVLLEADAQTCAVAVEAGSGVVGTCADGGGGLFSCTLDGASALALAPGTRAVEVRGTGPDGATSSCTSWVQVLDVTPPQVAVTPAPAVLWPPNHALVQVDIGAAAWDACEGAVAPTCTATSSEPEGPACSERPSPDIVWRVGALWLRAERSGHGPGRTYTVTCEAVDSAGNLGRASGTVTVPHRAPR